MSVINGIMIDNPRLFGAHIRALRQRAGLKPKDICKELNIDLATYRRIEVGSNKSWSLSNELLEGLMELIDLRLALAPGVTPGPMRKDDIEDDVKHAKKLLY